MQSIKILLKLSRSLILIFGVNLAKIFCKYLIGILKATAWLFSRPSVFVCASDLGPCLRRSARCHDDTFLLSLLRRPCRLGHSTYLCRAWLDLFYASRISRMSCDTVLFFALYLNHCYLHFYPKQRHLWASSSTWLD